MRTTPTRARQALAEAEAKAIRAVHRAARPAGRAPTAGELAAAVGGSWDPRDGWTPQQTTAKGWERCTHRPEVAWEASRRTRMRVEACELCGAWRLAPLPTPRAPRVPYTFHIEGPFCWRAWRPETPEA